MNPNNIPTDPFAMTRRGLLVGATASLVPAMTRGDAHDPALQQAIARLEYLTREKDFGNVERGNPLPWNQPEAKLRAIGMTRDTWSLEVVPDAGSKVENPLTKERGSALTFAGLMKLAETRSVRYMKVMTCNNLNAPLGMGLWEGVPLRDVIWMTRPVGDIRRVYYYGHHNEDPKQMFRSSLSISRVLEDPPGDYPVLLCYKLNGDWLSGHRGGPVRILVPEAYGFKSVKWLKRVVLTNLSGANDTYAEENNDIESGMKSYARFLTFPRETKRGDVIPVTGLAQVGLSGLKKVQVWLRRHGEPLPAGDPTLSAAPWRDAELIPSPQRWGGGLPEGNLPPGVLGIDSQTGTPKSWPMRYSIVHWATLLKDLPRGKHELRCRTIDANGIAQPMPRPFGRSGINHIESVEITVT